METDSWFIWGTNLNSKYQKRLGEFFFEMTGYCPMTHVGQLKRFHRAAALVTGR